PSSPSGPMPNAAAVNAARSVPVSPRALARSRTVTGRGRTVSPDSSFPSARTLRPACSASSSWVRAARSRWLRSRSPKTITSPPLSCVLYELSAGAAAGITDPPRRSPVRASHFHRSPHLFGGHAGVQVLTVVHPAGVGAVEADAAPVRPGDVDGGGVAPGLHPDRLAGGVARLDRDQSALQGPPGLGAHDRGHRRLVGRLAPVEPITDAHPVERAGAALLTPGLRRRGGRCGDAQPHRARDEQDGPGAADVTCDGVHLLLLSGGRERCQRPNTGGAALNRNGGGTSPAFD